LKTQHVPPVDARADKPEEAVHRVYATHDCEEWQERPVVGGQEAVVVFNCQCHVDCVGVLGFGGFGEENE